MIIYVLTAESDNAIEMTQLFSLKVKGNAIWDSLGIVAIINFLHTSFFFHKINDDRHTKYRTYQFTLIRRTTKSTVISFIFV